MGRALRTDIIEELLLAHVELRQLICLASSLASSSATATAADAARRICEFIDSDYCLHIADEEQTLRPRLVGRHAVVDDALVVMLRDHFRIAATLARLRGLCSLVANEPTMLHTHRFALDLAVGELARHVERHHAHEESIVFPAVRRLLEAGQVDDMLQEMVDRRLDAMVGLMPGPGEPVVAAQPQLLV